MNLARASKRKTQNLRLTIARPWTRRSSRWLSVVASTFGSRLFLGTWDEVGWLQRVRPLDICNQEAAPVVREQKGHPNQLLMVAGTFSWQVAPGQDSPAKSQEAQGLMTCTVLRTFPGYSQGSPREKHGPGRAAGRLLAFCGTKSRAPRRPVRAPASHAVSLRARFVPRFTIRRPRKREGGAAAARDPGKGMPGAGNGSFLYSATVMPRHVNRLPQIYTSSPSKTCADIKEYILAMSDRIQRLSAG
ncbi:hypothetical protein GQ53DRAFT_371225 [Thozetella sp. PMI_491]|nr:hypothetical protein GQ53DRAFT_371225 [Thozetella sp. PMI_491]